MTFIKKLTANQAIRYIFFGGCTTMVNLCTYYILRMILGIDMTVANFISIGLSILFAYVVNKLFVFESKKNSWKEVLLEASQFIGMRLGTMFIEVFGMILLSCVWGISDLAGKLVIQVVVLVLNYIFSRCFVFREREDISMVSPKELGRRKVVRNTRIWGFALPALTMIVGFAANGVYPFGDHGVLIIDSLHQYLPFFTEFHEKLTSNSSLLYSFGGGLGFNFWATFAYYLASPLNFLVTLFPKSHMMDVMALFIVLKIGLCGYTMSYYLTTKGKGKNYFPLMFSTMFALSSFMIGYYFNLMWLDSIAMLPLIMLGIERIVRGENGKVFCLSLFYGLYCNYYIGFMLCFFSCLYFLVQWISSREYSIKKIAISCLWFGWYALLAGGMAAIVLLPAYDALSITESMENGFPETVKLFVENLSQFTSQFAFVTPVNIADNQIPVNAYCGVLALIFAVLYALDPYILKRERGAKIGLCIFLFAGFNVNVLNYIWHGFHTQNGLPNRFAFVYIAVLVVMGYDVIQHVKKISISRLAVSCLAPIMAVIACMYFMPEEQELYVYVGTIAILVVYTFVLFLYRLQNLGEMNYRTMIMSLCLGEMVATSIFGICMNGTVGRSTYVDEQLAYEVLMENNEFGDDFFRSDIDSTRMRNEDMFMGANGVVLFSSTMPAATVDLCKAVGMEARTNKNGYNGLTKLVNDIFGVRYVVSRTDAPHMYQMGKVDYEEPLNLYKNPGALALGFVVNSEVKDWEIYSGDPFEVQNEFVSLATGKESLFTWNQSIEMEDAQTYTISLPAGKQVYLNMLEATESLTITTPEYTKTYDRFNDHLYDLGCFDGDQVATITCTFRDGQSGPLTAEVYVCEDDQYSQVHDILAQDQLELTSWEDGKIKGVVNSSQNGTLMMSIPYDEGWMIKLDGEEVKPYRVGEALTGIDITEGEHTISMSYTPDGLVLGSILTIVCAGLFAVTGLLEKKRDQVRP